MTNKTNVSPVSQTPDSILKEKLEQLIPEAFSEGKLNIDKLKAVLGDNVLAPNFESYGLNWAGKHEVYGELKTPTSQTLTPQPDESVDFDSTQNLFIEGDNLAVLKILQKSYYNRIKMIYIDPPYNTGNDRFIYPDDYSESIKAYQERAGQTDDEGNLTHSDGMRSNSKENGQYHSNWLNMMYPRLALAKNLLRDDGVIFVSIDDNEVANLRLLMDEMFGEENFVSSIIWEKKFSPQNDAKYLSENHDYILMFAKNISDFKVKLLPRTEEANSRYKNYDDDPRGLWISDNLLRKDMQPSGVYTITTPNGKKYDPPSGRSWRVSKNKFDELVKDNRIWFGKEGGNVPRLKRFLSEVQDGMRPISIWKHNEVGHNQEASQELRKIFTGTAFFDTPKPLRLLRHMLFISNTSKDDLVLDFFAGSSTTAHAVMALNAEEAKNSENNNVGKRKFIMVQIPEATEEDSEAYKAGFTTIAEISKERIRRSGQQILAENPDLKDSNLDIGFKAYKLTDSNFIPWQQPDSYDADSLLAQLEKHVNPIVEDATDSGLVTELMLKEGHPITLPILSINNNRDYYFTPKLLDSANDTVTLQQTADSRQQTADSRQQTADSRQQTADRRPQRLKLA